ncbi:MAG: ABC transporter permease, partial [Corynebacterium sp.]|nr:ABC transporter permease [Corynebacterium sp.]
MVTMIADLTGAELLAQEPMMLFTPIQMLAMPVLAIQGIMIVTTEYRYKAQMNTYLATNKRWQAALVKACMYAAIAALLVFIACIVVLWMAGSLGNDNDLVQRILWVFPLGMALLVFFGQGLGLLLRQTAGVVALTLILYLGLGNLVMFIPKIGEDLVNYMPFTALNNFLLNTPSASAPWEGVAGFGWIF